MEKIIINGGKKLKGTVHISGAKNAALPIIAASILCDGIVELSNMPELKDVDSMCELLEHLGAKYTISGRADVNGSKNRKCIIDPRSINNQRAEYELVRKMRASVLVLGPLLSKYGNAQVSLPGGCAIGARPVDLHIMALEKMGAQIEIIDGYIIAKSQGKLKGTDIHFEIVSVGATENIIAAAVLAEGITTIHNAAQEPEVQDLIDFLNKCGARITGSGTSTIKIEGVASLHSCSHSIIGDRIEAGTYAIAAGITGGAITLHGIQLEYIANILDVLQQAGLIITINTDQSINIECNGILCGIELTTAPFPHFPTDMQAQVMTLLCKANSDSYITEQIFESRFMHVPELVRMGANIKIDSCSHAIIHGGMKNFKAAEVMATDLRASAALVLAGLSATGQTIVHRVYHLKRGYGNLVEKLQSIGADIYWAGNDEV